MDPVSQGVLGAVVTQGANRRSDNLKKSAWIGAIAAMAPDLDVLIRSASDPLLAIEFHRHFTHSLLFIPIGGLLCSLILHPLLGKRWQLNYRETLSWCLIGYATHGLLDGCTSYGTQLLWPLSNQRFAWDTISVVDPLFTLPLLILVYSAVRRRSKRFAYCGLAWILFYLSCGYIQHERAQALGWQVAAQRGHAVKKLEVKPSFANLAVWKLVYETDDRFYVDALKPGITEPVIWPGDSIEKLDVKRHLSWLDPDSQQARDVERFAWFSDGYVAPDPRNNNQIVDIRYSLLPDQISPLWGIRLSPDSEDEQHAEYYAQRGNGLEAIAVIIGMIFE